MDQISDLLIFEAAQTAGDLRTVFAAEPIAPVTNGTIVVIDLMTGVRIGILRQGEPRDEKKTRDNRNATKRQTISFRCA